MTAKQRRRRLEQIYDGLIAIAESPYTSSDERWRVLRSIETLERVFNSPDMVMSGQVSNDKVIADLINCPVANIDLDDIVIDRASPDGQN